MVLQYQEAGEQTCSGFLLERDVVDRVVGDQMFEYDDEDEYHVLGGWIEEGDEATTNHGPKQFIELSAQSRHAR